MGQVPQASAPIEPPTYGDAKWRRTVYIDGVRPATLIYLPSDDREKAGPRRGRPNNKAKVRMEDGAMLAIEPRRLSLVASAKPLCHCGRELHYRNPDIERGMLQFIATHGEFVLMSTDEGTWRVQRHYAALHPIRDIDLPALGFEQVS